jgi:hypothetical protein
VKRKPEVEACCKVQASEQNSSHKRNLETTADKRNATELIGPVARRPTPGTLFGARSARVTALVKVRSAVRVGSEYALGFFLSRDLLKGRMLKCVPRHRSPIKRGTCFEVVKLIRLYFSGHHELWSLPQSVPLKDDLKLVPPPPPRPK